MIIYKQLKNRKEVYNFITGDKILDVGGGSLPCGKANYIIDIMPYEFANLKESWPFFEKPSVRKKENYIQHDICSRKPFPYPDKFFDFSICFHTLEDIRDPIWVLSEIARVSKVGYIETPYTMLSEIKQKKYLNEIDIYSKALSSTFDFWLSNFLNNKTNNL